jgi:hypothetical protein
MEARTCIATLMFVTSIIRKRDPVFVSRSRSFRAHASSGAAEARQAPRAGSTTGMRTAIIPFRPARRLIAQNKIPDPKISGNLSETLGILWRIEMENGEKRKKRRKTGGRS